MHNSPPPCKSKDGPINNGEHLENEYLIFHQPPAPHKLFTEAERVGHDHGGRACPRNSNDDPRPLWKRNIRTLSAAEERELYARASAGDAKARNSLIEGNRAACIKIAKRFRGDDLSFDDAISAAVIAFIEVLDAGRFDPTHGSRLLTFAWKAMKGAVRATARAARGVIDTPEGKMPRIEESLDPPLSASDPEGETLGSTIPSPASDPVEIAAAQLRADRLEAIRRALDTFDPRARRVIEARHLAEEAKTQAAIALELGITRQRVAQIERDCLDELRRCVPRELRRQDERLWRRCHLGRKAPKAILRRALPDQCVDVAWLARPAIIAVAEALQCQ